MQIIILMKTLFIFCSFLTLEIHECDFLCHKLFKAIFFFKRLIHILGFYQYDHNS